MIAFHGKQEVKDFYLKRIKSHALADEIVKGHYWEDGKGCAVGCTIHGSKHSDYEKELGIPEWLARTEDAIFEGLPNARAKIWPEQFLNAIKPGADLEKVKVPFLIFILEQDLKSLDVLPDMTMFPDVNNAINLTREAIKEMIRCHQGKLDLSSARSAAESARSAAESARSSARSAAESARSAAWSAAESAAWSAARSSARSAAESAESAAESARSAAGSARSAARSAARSSAWSARSAAGSAESAAYKKYADKLIELMEQCE